MKVSLIALYACCAVSSAAFAYQNSPQAGHVGPVLCDGHPGAQFVMRDDPGVSPPKAALMDEPGVSPPKVAVMDEPGVTRRRLAVMDDPGVSPPKARGDG